MKRASVLLFVIMFGNISMAQDSYSFFNLASYDYFRIGRKYKEDPDDIKSRYIGKTVIFYEPLNEKQKTRGFSVGFIFLVMTK